jgi:hypothetical protein
MDSVKHFKERKKMAIKKPVAKKPSAKKPTARAKTGTTSIKLLSATGKTTKRPPNNPDMPQTTIDQINLVLNELKNLLDDFSQHLRALDRRRLNGVGIHKLGFVERAYELALENAEFLPHYLTIERFGTDIQYFVDFRSLTDLTSQIREKLWNITIQSADIAYTDALEFYASVREAAKRRVDAAETIHAGLSVFFKSHGRRSGEEPTEKELERDIKALLHSKRDGKIVIENIKPKLTGGTHKVLDEKFSGNEQYKETIQGSEKE